MKNTTFCIRLVAQYQIKKQLLNRSDSRPSPGLATLSDIIAYFLFANLSGRTSECFDERVWDMCL